MLLVAAPSSRGRRGTKRCEGIHQGVAALGASFDARSLHSRRTRGAAESLIAHEDNFAALRHSPVPIIAALQGNVIGGGLELALSVNVRVATPDTKLAIPASKLGLIYSEAGIRLVIAAVGESVARAMFLAGFVLDANAAYARGLVVDIVGREQLRDRAMELPTMMASWSPLASIGNRRIIDVIVGRVVDDTKALRLASFAPHGDLAKSIADFVARRSGAIPASKLGLGKDR